MKCLSNTLKSIFILSLVLLILSSCISNKAVYKLSDENYNLYISKNNFTFHFTDKKGNIVVPADSISGMSISGSNVESVELINSKSKNKKDFKITTASGKSAIVEVFFDNGIVKFIASPLTEENNIISIRFGGMPVAHGLGDEGAFGESFNLVEKEPKVYEIIHNGGTRRWLTTFTVFPQNQFAGIFFDKGKRKITLGKDTYQMSIEKTGSATFYCFVGEMKDIYSNYKTVRNRHGFEEIYPKQRLFELGWESWDPLGWQMSHITVKDLLQKFLNNGYPIKWAVTGSGFWEKGGTTTSFGKWGEKFPNPQRFKSWMHKNDIYWMIGLRTNFVPSGGPYEPVVDKIKKKNKFYNGNNHTTEAIAKDYLLKDSANNLFKIHSTQFPQVVCYMLDGNNPKASEWYQSMYLKWNVDGIKEDAMMNMGWETSIYNGPISEIANKGALVMARTGNFSSAGTLQRINDTHVNTMYSRTPINYFQYAACGFPNVYSDAAGIKNMRNLNDIDASIRHAWLLSMTAGMSLGVYPDNWTKKKQDAFKKTVDVHYELVPYMYSAAVETYKTGYPYTLTPLNIAFPNDEKASELKNYQWMIGESLMATPLLKNHETGKLDVYLPKGIWYDYDNGTKYEGPITLENYDLPVSKTPCFVGGKGIVLHRSCENDKLSVIIYPVVKNVESVFYDENGEKCTVAIGKPDWKKPQVTNKITGSIIRFEKKRHAFVFEIEMGCQYVIN